MPLLQALAAALMPKARQEMLPPKMWFTYSMGLALNMELIYKG